MASFKLPLRGLTFGTKEFSYQLSEDFFNETGASEVHRASVAATLKVVHEHEGIYELHFAFKGELQIPCDRCLDLMPLEVDTTWQIRVKYGPRYDDSCDDVLMVPESWRELDLQPLMRDTVLLTIPIKHVHPEGGCNEQMMAQLSSHAAIDLSDDDDYMHQAGGGDEDNNDDDNDNAEKGTDPRWDALKQLLDKN